MSSRSLLKCVGSQIQQHRFRKHLSVRKPIWYPTAPTKIYDIKEKPKLSIEEQKRIDEQEIDYRNKYRSIQAYFRTNFYEVAAQGGLTLEEIKEEAKSQKELIDENEKENRKQEERRAERWKKEEQENDQDFLMEQLRLNEQHILEREDTLEKIEIEKRRFDTYITDEKLVEAINTAMDNVISYDFAIDLSGQVLFDKRLHPYALKPSAIPETSNILEEYSVYDTEKYYLEEQILTEKVTE